MLVTPNGGMAYGASIIAMAMPLADVSNTEWRQ